MMGENEHYMTIPVSEFEQLHERALLAENMQDVNSLKLISVLKEIQNIITAALQDAEGEVKGTMK